MRTFWSQVQSYKFSRHGYWTLFLMAAFPTHLWTIILVMRDFSWLTERTNSWDAFGVGAYGLLIAFAESLFVFLAALVLSLLVPARWEEKKRLTLLIVLVILVALWDIAGQLYFMLGGAWPAGIINLLTGTGHPVRVLYAIYATLVAPTIILPVFLLIKSQKLQAFLQNVIERLSVLSALYLSLDAVALIIVIVRNVQGTG